jgi:photosystem II stability/assembly factor-like uncharacterized protein
MLLTTSDAGAKWQKLRVPPVSLSATNGPAASVTFADRDNGWLEGSSLWATHDGGHQWQRIRLPGDPENAQFEKLQAPQLSDVIASGGWAYVALSTVSRVTLLRTPVDANDWQPVPGKLPHGKWVANEEGLTANGSSAWLGLAWQTRDSDEYGIWQAVGGSSLIYRSNPCSHANYGIVGMAASTPNDLVVSCGPPKLLTSSDGGSQLARVPAPDASNPNGGDINASMAAPLGRPRTILMAWPSNFGFAGPPTNNPSWIDRTTNDGRTWTRAYYHDQNAGWADLQFLGPRIGWVIHGYPGAATDQLMHTTNAGAIFTATRF